MEKVKRIRVGAITLALGLIIIGSLWTLQNIFPMTWIPRMVDLWPILLIIYGLEIIITKFMYEGKEGVVVSMDVGIIILLIFVFLVLGGISFINTILPHISFYL